MVLKKLIGQLLMAGLVFGISVPLFSKVVTRTPAAIQLHQIFEDSWNEDMRQSPVWASMLGDRRYNDQWQDLSKAAFVQRAEQAKGVLKRLESIDLERLSGAGPGELSTSFSRLYSERVGGLAEHPTHLMPISQRGGIQTLDETGDRLGLQSVQDFEDWLARLEQIDVLMDQTIDLMTQGIEQGYVPPKITMEPRTRPDRKAARRAAQPTVCSTNHSSRCRRPWRRRIKFDCSKRRNRLLRPKYSQLTKSSTRFLTRPICRLAERISAPQAYPMAGLTMSLGYAPLPQPI